KAPSATGTGTKPDTLDILVSALADVPLRPLLTYLLLEVKDDRVARKMRELLDDKEASVRSNALYNLGVNQDLSAIPGIVKLSLELERGKEKSAFSPAGGLSFYKSREAIPLLNPLLTEDSEGVRMCAMEALLVTADKTSIPYLVEALDNDDKQHLFS